MWISLDIYRVAKKRKDALTLTYPPVIHRHNGVILTYPQCYPRTYPQKLVLMCGKKGYLTDFHMRFCRFGGGPYTANE